MIDYEVLKKFKTTNKSLKAFFLAREKDNPPEAESLVEREIARLESLREDEGEDEPLSEKAEKQVRKEYLRKLVAKKDKWIQNIHDRLDEGRLWNLNNYRFYFAADLAFDGRPVVNETIPLTLYAQNKLNVQECAKQLEEVLGEDEAKEYIIKESGGKTSIDLGRFSESALNLIRPFVTRRVAAQTNRFANLYPFFKYEPRAKTHVGNLRSDAVSQRVEVITDQYGYRPEFTQWLRKCFLHGHTVAFVESAWDREKQYRKNFLESTSDAWELEEVITKEGVKFVTPHPSRVFYDMASPLSSVNYDNGVEYLGFWDVVQAKDIQRDSGYFNRNEIKTASALDDLYTSYQSFFDAYYPDTVIKFPAPTESATQIALKNERKTNTGLLTDAEDDQAVFLATYYEKVIPKDKGFGDYPHPVWVKLVIANDDTVVHAEILPSTPAAYMGYNEDDGRLLNAGMAHEILPYQDQADNLMSQLVYLMRLESFMILAIDVDSLEDDAREYIKKFVKTGRFHSEALIAEYSSGDEEELRGKNPVRDSPFKFQTSDLHAQIAETFRGITNIIGLLEKTQMFSPQELGQFVEREVSASEVVEVANTTTALFNFTSQGPDEFRAAMKRILYESLMASGKNEVYVPIVDTYPDDVIRAAGFKVTNPEEIENYDVQSNLLEVQQTITGSKNSLVHDYIFNSRDGAVRTQSVEAAQAIFQFLGTITGNEAMVKAVGQKQLFEMITEAFRLSGTTITLKLNPESEGDQQTPEGAPSMEEILQVIQQNAQGVQELDGAVTQIAQQLQLQLGTQPPAPQNPVDAAQQQELAQQQAIQDQSPTPQSAIGPPNI